MSRGKKLIYTVVIKTQEGYALSTSVGLDWWEARNSAALSAGVDPTNIIAMIPGQHHSTLIFQDSGIASRPLDQVPMPPRS